MKNEYYKKLGIKPDASGEEIKKAFRARARGCHPDHHPGNKEKENEFKEISLVYACLSDPAARAHYDEVGEAPRVDNIHSEAVELIVQLFNAIRTDKKDELLSLDLIGEIRIQLKAIEFGTQQKIKECEDANTQIDKLVEKIIHKEGRLKSFLHRVLEKEKVSNEGRKQNNEHGLTVFARAFILLDDYQFNPDKKDELTAPFGGVQFNPVFFTFNVNKQGGFER